MSWFPNQPVDDDERAGEEVAEGALVERREVIALSLGALAAYSLGWPQRALAEDAGGAAAGNEDDGELAWDTLIQKAIPQAERLVAAPKPNEEAYLARLNALMARLKDIPDAAFRGQGAVASTDVYRKLPFVVVQFRIQPNAAIPYHDHRDYIGLLASVTGEARIRSFEIVGQELRPAPGKTFEIRETQSGLLTPRRVSTLTRSRDNIHDVRAGKDGARLLDFFTFFAKDGRSVFLNVSDKPKDPGGRTYEASFK